ncbi:DUF397 domain-containing protein [Actinomadura sp. KC216]|uniref:DUF397 domain-containing protein n=1 Tax=Actinomadura sp. KC216 TaxID=2530370 RepID=UPI00105027A6|nr:DUF397 domain-containing protein [Actinomadura sp. KC216]TDB80992.1 DUF397 domain-containing protein [Actinomadura sp. KC216]
MENVNWKKSSRSGNGGPDCVELARIANAVAARDSRNPRGPRHEFSVAAMTALFADIRRGRYDLP